MVQYIDLTKSPLLKTRIPEIRSECENIYWEQPEPDSVQDLAEPSQSRDRSQKYLTRKHGDQIDYMNAFETTPDQYETVDSEFPTLRLMTILILRIVNIFIKAVAKMKSFFPPLVDRNAFRREIQEWLV